MRAAKYRWHYLQSSLRWRIIFGTMASVVVAAIVIGFAGLMLSRNHEHQKKIDLVSTQTALLSVAVNDALDALKADLQILARNPVVLDAAARLPTEAPTGDGNSKTREIALATFGDFLRARESYDQIRLIDLTHQGRELLRVNRSGSGVVFVPKDHLQVKKSEPYYSVGADLDQGQIGILSISWNREFGVIEEPKRAMMRALKPVFDDTGTKLAFLVINIDIAELLKSILDGLAIDFPIYMTSGTNSLLLLDPNTGTIDISIGSFGDNPEWISNAVRAATAVQKISEYDNKLVVSQQIRETRLQDGELHLGLLGNFDDAFIYMRKSSLYAVFGLILILGSTAVAIHRTDHQLRPLLQMKEEVSLAWHDGHFPDLPVDRNDEVGDLARSFNRLVETLTDRETTAKAVFNGVSHGIVITNGEGHITDANTALLEMFDCTISDLMGQQIDILLPASLFQSHIDFIQRKIPARKFEKIGSTEAVVPNFSGVDFDIEVTTNGMTDWPNPSTVSIIRDVSERKFIEREVLQLVENLERSNKDLEDFAYVASHDLKAPLRAIKQIAEWLEEDLSDKLDPDSQENLATLQQRANRMSSLLDSLLEHARIGRGRKKTHSDIITGDAMAETLFSLLSLPEGFSVEFDDNFKSISMNEMPLQIVLLNLISNGIKHNNRANGHVWVTAQEIENKIEFSITDDGPGIDPRFHERVFRLFQTLQSRDELEGSGMGLAIAKRHVEIAGGNIRLISDGNGSGSQFLFTWPKTI